MSNQKWEYLVKKYKEDNLEEELNKLGNIGWELVKVQKTQYFSQCIFKRPKKYNVNYSKKTTVSLKGEKEIITPKKIPSDVKELRSVAIINIDNNAEKKAFLKMTRKSAEISFEDALIEYKKIIDNQNKRVSNEGNS